MRIRIITIFIFLVCLTSCGTTQQVIRQSATVSELDLYNLKNIIEIKQDNLKNLILLTDDSRVLIFTENNQLSFEYNNRSDGIITHIDATNPQMILCFAEDFNRLLFLDNTLSEVGRRDLLTSEYLDVTTIGRSNDGLMWVFDPVNQVLVKIDDQLKEIVSSNRLSDFGFDEVYADKIRERANRVVMLDEIYGLFVFDNFGKFVKLIPEEGIVNFQLFDKSIVYQKEGKLYAYDFKLFNTEEVLSDIREGEKVFFLDNTTYLKYGVNGVERKSLSKN